MSLALANRRAAISPAWVKNPLWRTARAVPSLDLPFADIKSLADAVTGQSLVTFTRASSGTSVGSDGLIKTATTNLLLRSEEFDNASWTKITATVTSNVATAPSGTVTADKLIVDNGQSAGYASQTISFVSGTSYTVSCYAKAGEVSDFRFVFESGAFGSNLNAIFNLNTGVVSSFTAASASIQSVGNGWYRCVATALATATASAGVQFRSVHAGNGTNGILLWGAQLEQSSTVGEYIPTTSTINSAPRFDHNPTTGESLGLLVEEQRTNICPQSEDFTNNQAINNVTISSNQIAAPDGAVTADLVTATLAGSSNTCWVQQVASIAASTTSYASSCFVKQGTSPSVTLNVAFSGGTYTEIFVRFDFSTKSISIGGGGAGAATAGYQQLQNGWFRVWAVFPNNNTGTTITHRIYTRSEGTTNAVGDSVYLWGRMTEAGAFPTSYIPTTTATATRSADVASITGTAFSSWYRQDEGTVFASVRLASLVNTYEASFTDNSNNNHHFLRYVSGQHQIITKTGGVDGTNIYSDGGSGIAIARHAYGYKTSSFAISTNGLGGSFSTTANTVPTVDRLNIGMSQLAAATGNLHVSRFTYWPARLPNSTLQAISQ